MKKLNEIPSVVLHFLQGEISEDELRELNLWLNECAENKQLFFQLKDIYDRRKGGLFPDQNEVEQSWLRLQQKLHVRKPNRQRWWAMPLRYAAVAAIVVGLTLAVQKLFDTEAPSYVELSVEAGPRMSHLSLPDGSKVVLNSSTKFRFPDRFGVRQREVFLDGEAFFSVAHNPDAPFVVRTARQKICVTGTTFNVMDYATDDYAVTTLVDGSVTVQELSADGEAGATYRLRPGEQVYLDKLTQKTTLSAVQLDTSRMWVNKIYHFRDETLLNITQRLEKIYGIRIRIADEVLKTERYTGTFPTNAGIENVLEIFNFEKSFAFELNDEGVVVSRR